MESDAAPEQGNLEVTDEDLKGSPKTDDEGTGSQPKDSTKGSGKAKEKGPAPWDARLKELGLGDDPRFSEFIASDIQPYITQLEQGGGGEFGELFGGDIEQAQVARELMEHIISNPVEAYYELAELLGFSEDEDEYSEGYEDPDGEYAGDDDYGTNEPVDNRLSWVEQRMQDEQAQYADEMYENELHEIENRIGPIDRQLFTNFVLAAQGDIQQAFDQYIRYHNQVAPQEEPPAMDGGGTAPPEAPTYSSLDDAIGDYLTEENSRRG